MPRVLTTKEKAIHFDQLKTDRNGTSYFMKMAKVTGLEDYVSYYFYDDGHQAVLRFPHLQHTGYQFDQLTGTLSLTLASYNWRFSTFSILPNTLLWQWRSCSDRLANPSTASDYYFPRYETWKTGNAFVIGDRACNADVNGGYSDRKANSLPQIVSSTIRATTIIIMIKSEKVTGFQEVDGKVPLTDVETSPTCHSW